MGNSITQKTTVTYDGETIEISPIEISRAQEILNGLGISKTCATFGTETTLINPTPGGELFGALCIRTNNDHAIALCLFNAFFSELFPSTEGLRDFISVSEN
ncbi:hypothetical protein SRABI106_01302 [Rahnella aquatilis]|nr:hypothetical protein SRABI106_01302 [Rahnella aquatilis]